jgi:hypothetical protein
MLKCSVCGDTSGTSYLYLNASYSYRRNFTQYIAHLVIYGNYHTTGIKLVLKETRNRNILEIPSSEDCSEDRRLSTIQGQTNTSSVCISFFHDGSVVNQVDTGEVTGQPQKFGQHFRCHTLESNKY